MACTTNGVRLKWNSQELIAKTDLGGLRGHRIKYIGILELALYIVYHNTIVILNNIIIKMSCYTHHVQVDKGFS